MEKEELYIGSKIIRAIPMTHVDFMESQGKPIDGENAHGYKVIYPDGYISWSPKMTFENAYRFVTNGEKLLFTDKGV